MSVVPVRPTDAAWLQEVGPRGVQLLTEASALIGATQDEDGLLREVGALCLRGSCDWVTIYLCDDTGRARLAWAASDRSASDEILQALLQHPGSPSGVPLLHQVVATARGRLAPDLGAALAEDGAHRGLLRRLGDGNGVAVPLHARGRVLGVLAMASAGLAYGPGHVSLAEALGRQVGLAIDNARLIAREQKARLDAEAAVTRIARLQGVTAALAEALTPDEVGRVAAREVARASGAHACTMSLLSDGALEVVAGGVGGRESYPLSAALPLCEAIRAGHPYYLEDATAASGRFRDLAAMNARTGQKAVACLPLLLNGRAVGGLCLSYREPRGFSHEERGFLEALARQVAQAYERARLFGSEQRARGEAEAAADALRVTERRFRTLIEQFPLSTQVFGADGRHVAANAAWERLTGRDRASLEGYDLLRDPVFQEPRMRDLVERTFAGEVVELPLRAFEPAPGEVRQLRSILFPVRDAEGRPREVVMVTEDVTDRLRAVDEVRASEARYRLIAERTLDIISRLSPEGVALYVSPACRRILGYEPDELIGRPVESFIHPEDRLPPGVIVSDLLGATDQYTRTYRRVRKDGSYAWLEMTGHGVRDPATGELKEIVTVSRDITERRRAEQEIEAGRRQVAQSEKLSALGSLVSGVAHEIRTPLAYITNHLFLIQQRLDKVARAPEKADLPALFEEVRGYGTEALDGADRINALVKELSRFIRQTAGPRRPTPLHEVVAEAVRLFQATHRGGMTVEADLRATPAVELDRVQVQQVVLNLLENAHDACPPGSRARVVTRAGPEGVELVVEDSGPGIPPDVQARMFDPFFTTKPHGTGLGLSIVRRIVETHRATLRCESSPGKGTRFILAFPLAPGA